MQYFPLFVDTSALKVLIVGAGEVASRKLALLARTHASIHLIAPDATHEVSALVSKGRVTFERRGVQPQDMTGFDLIYLATADEALNVQMASIATGAGIWVNVVDNPKHCRFITPSIIDRGRLVVAISTAGAAPVFARSLRVRLESLLPQSLGPLFDFVAQKRDEVQLRVTSPKDRRLFWEQFFHLNGDRWDEQTLGCFGQSFDLSLRQGHLLLLNSDTPAQLLPLAVMGLFSQLDCIYTDKVLPFELNELLRRDANRAAIPDNAKLASRLALGERMLVVADEASIAALKRQFPDAKQISPGSL